MSLIPLPDTLVPFLEDYLPRRKEKIPFVTLTYAQSLDARIAAQHGVQTKISHLETKTMTHYLRSKHDGILIGIGTVLADDPKLNCRYCSSDGDSDRSPRPIVIDPHAKWIYSKSQLRGVCDDGKGLAPFIVVDHSAEVSEQEQEILCSQGGRFVKLSLLQETRERSWDKILEKLIELGVHSVMIEGGAKVINDLLLLQKKNQELVDSLIVTVGPVFLGVKGVEVSPLEEVRLNKVKWWTGVQDSVLCAKLSNGLH